MLAMASASEDKTLGGHADVEQNPPGTPQKSEWSSYLKSDDCVSPTRVKNGGFRFSIDAGRPEGAGVVVTHKATESVDMAYSWNPGTVLAVGGSEKPAGVATSSRKVPIGGGDSTRAPGPIDGELARTMAKVVVVHPPHEQGTPWLSRGGTSSPALAPVGAVRAPAARAPSEVRARLRSDSER